MEKGEIKDSVEFLAVNATGIGLSLGNIDAQLRTFILLCTAIYGVIKILKGYKDLMRKHGKKKETK